jgi:hypothetical protein
MSFFNSLKMDLADKRLWPVVVVLAICAIGIPVAVTKTSSSSGPKPTAVANEVPPLPAGQPAPASELGAVAGPNTPRATRYRGAERNPFRGTPGVKSATSTTTQATKVAGGSSGTSGKSSSKGSSGGASTGSGGTTAPQTLAKPTTPRTFKPVPTVLTPTQSYAVTVAMTTADGGVDTIDPLQRLAILPSAKQPLLVYLGQLQGHRESLFAVESGTVVSGPGRCTPGPTDCEVLALSAGQIEIVAARSGSATVPVAMFAVTAMKVAGHATVAAARRARHDESAAGRTLLGNSPLPVLALFQYDPSLGAVIDLRNLNVGGK